MAFKMKYGKGMPFNYGSALKKPQEDGINYTPHDYKEDSNTRVIKDANGNILNPPHDPTGQDPNTYTLGTDPLGKPINANDRGFGPVPTFKESKVKKITNKIKKGITNTAKTIVSGGLTGILARKAKKYYDDNIKGTTRTKTKTTTSPDGK